jgi:TfoX/Sxy family transcriptional regulator of competence genes
MAYNEYLADRVRLVFRDKGVTYLEKRMMGGLVFMVDDKMCVGIVKDDLMARIDPELNEEALKRKGCREMDFTGASMKGFMFINLEGTDMDEDLDYWVQLALNFNPKAKASKKK